MLNFKSSTREAKESRKCTNMRSVLMISHVFLDARDKYWKTGSKFWTPRTLGPPILPSGKGISPFSIGNTSSKGSFSIAMLVYQRVKQYIYINDCCFMFFCCSWKHPTFDHFWSIVIRDLEISIHPWPMLECADCLDKHPSCPPKKARINKGNHQTLILKRAATPIDLQPPL